jgi:hypothetical protein
VSQRSDENYGYRLMFAVLAVIVTTVTIWQLETNGIPLPLKANSAWVVFGIWI